MGSPGWSDQQFRKPVLSSDPILLPMERNLSLSLSDVFGEWFMRSKADEYRLNAVNCVTVAEGTSDVAMRAGLLAMAQAWRSLADQADRNSQADLVYETPEPSRAVAQQQQQRQPKKEDERILIGRPRPPSP